MAFYAMAFMGMTPFGSLLAGSFGGMIGVRDTVMAGGILCIIGALLFAKDIHAAKKMIPAFKKEMTPEIETGIESSEEITDSL